MSIFFALGLVLTYIFTPFILWRSFFHIAANVLSARGVGLAARARLFWHLAKDLLWLPLLTWAWWLDELFVPAYRRADASIPVFIMSQPRSGAMSLMRTLAMDERSFFALTHLEWRLPFVLFWRLIDRIGLRRHLERINDWPDTPLGRLASRLHAHELGSLVEHGVFFEERMYHHYLCFRRFPFPGALCRATDVEGLTDGERRKLVGTFSKVVRKVAHYRGAGRLWLTCENDSVELYRLLHRAFPTARFVVMARDPAGFVDSYIAMSRTCTRAKHGVDPGRIAGWHEANLAFRRRQCEQQAAFCRQLEDEGRVVYTSFEAFDQGIRATVERLYDELGLPPVDEPYRARLRQLQRRHERRERPPEGVPCETAGFEAFSAFVQDVHPSSEPAPRPALEPCVTGALPMEVAESQ